MASLPSFTWNTTTSAFASVIGTNYAPSLSELVQLKAALVEPQRELHRLQLEIARVQAVLDALLSEKNRVKTYIDAHRALISPVRQIPYETLAEIFKWCLPSETMFGVRSLKHAPLLLTMVCRDWRRVAIETPRLWSSLHIYFPPHIAQDAQGAASQRIAGVNLWLQRSRTLPVSISLDGGSATSWIRSEEPRRSENMASLLKSLTSLHNRIQHLKLALTRTDLIAFHKLLPADLSFPYLVSLVLKDLSDHGTPFSVGEWGIEVNESAEHHAALLSKMPMLRSLDITLLKGPEYTLHHTLSCHWDILTNLSIRDFLTPSDLFGILARSGMLEILETGIKISVQDHLSDESTLPTATLDNLAVLHLRISINGIMNLDPFHIEQEEVERRQANHVAQVSAVVSHIICPSLKSLHVSLSGTLIASSQVPILSFPLHKLETLGLDMLMTPRAFAECLSLTPSLISLDFVDAGNLFRHQGKSTLEDAHLASLTPSASNLFPLCSQMRHLRMIDRSTDLSWSRCWSTRVLTDFIAARRGARMLDSFQLIFGKPPTFTNEEVSNMQKLKEDGLELHVHTKKNDVRHADEPSSGLVSPVISGSWPFTLSDLKSSCSSFDTEVII